MSYIDKESRQTDFLRLGVHGDFVFGILLRIEEARHEAAAVNICRPVTMGKIFGGDRG